MSKSGARRQNPRTVHSEDNDSTEEGPTAIPETGAPEIRLWSRAARSRRREQSGVPVRRHRTRRVSFRASWSCSCGQWRSSPSRWPRWEKQRAHPTHFWSGSGGFPPFRLPPHSNLAPFPQRALRELGAILSAPPPSDAIFPATLQTGPITAATSQTAAIDAATLHTATGAATTPHFAAVATATPQLGAGADVARQPSVTAVPLASPSGVPACASSPGLTSGDQRLWQLPPVQPFIATGGDWLAFQDRFDVAYTLVGWPMEEALRALPTCLDDRALQAFQSISPVDRASLPAAYQQMAAVFESPSSACLKFSRILLLPAGAGTGCLCRP
ncbi:unnamed protein product [Lampetra planeri]